MREYPTYGACNANAITEEYYYFLVGQINNKTCSKQVCKIERSNGSYKYYTYHLISQ